jgi:hypothetical protein
MDLARILLFIFKPADPRRPRIRIEATAVDKAAVQSLYSIYCFSMIFRHLGAHVSGERKANLLKWCGLHLVRKSSM